MPKIVAALLWLTTITTATAAGPGFSAVIGGSGQDYASSVASDAQGNTYVAGLTYSPDFRVTPGALQTSPGGGSDAFVAKFAPDGSLLWSTYLGGLGDDWATGVAVDAAGNVVVAGWTRSSDFPTVHAAQPMLNNGTSPARYDAFVAKLDATGTKLLYSTFLGGPDDDGAYALALDSSGSAYVTGTVQVASGFTGFPSAASGFGSFVTKFDPDGALIYSFFRPYTSFAGMASAGIAVDSTGSAYVTGTVSTFYPSGFIQAFGPQGRTQAVVFKLSPDGTRTIYETSIGGSAETNGMAIAVDRTGAAYIAGTTNSVDLPLVHPLQTNFGERSLWKSNDSGASWIALSDLPFAFPDALVVDPNALNIVYAAASDVGVFRSVDSGATWTRASKGISDPQIHSLVIDPLHSQTLFAADTSGVIYKTVDGGGNWIKVDTAKNPAVVQLAIDAQNPNIVYWYGGGVARKSSDDGATWSTLPFPGTSIQSLAVDPRMSGTLYATSTAVLSKGGPNFLPHVYRSTDGGATWVQLSYAPPNLFPNLTIDGSTNPSTVYVDLSARSGDAGATWTPLAPVPLSGGTVTAIAVDPAGTLYAAGFNAGMFVSHDRGATWTSLGNNSLPSNIAAIIPAGTSGTLYDITANNQTSGFVAKLSPDGSSVLFSTYLNGHATFGPVVTYAAQPGVFQTQNWISALTLDRAGNVVVAGGTRSTDFPLLNARQGYNAGRADAFAATISADGSRLLSSTYLGGSMDDGALAVAADTQGNITLAGQTWSLDFPVPGGVHRPAGLGEAFVTKLAPVSPPVITSVVNGASFQAGITAGSWVTIRGLNLANTDPGRTWRADEVVNGNLPVSLDGVSVTIDGKPAFVYFISPTQINVQAPSDTATGEVNVVVNNNGTASAPAVAQLKPAAPAFFQYAGTNYAVTSLFPGYVPVGDPATVRGAVPAHPGDTVIFWGTGFGATSPPAPSGQAVQGAHKLASPVAVTVGGLPATVLSTVLSPGAAGLYQVAIQLPATLPNGPAAVQATVGEAQSPAGVLTFIETPAP